MYATKKKKFTQKKIHAFCDSLWWLILIFFAGLIQVGILLFFGLSGEEQMKDIVKNIMENGSLLFFVTALVSSVIIDYYLSPFSMESKRKVGLIFVILPFFIIFSCTTTYSIFFFPKENHVFGNLTGDRDNFYKIELVVIAFSLLYALSAKWIQLFIFEIQNTSERKK